MESHPFISVITPTYNRGRTYLVETMESVLAQDYPNFEYLVLDDGSTDDTAAVLARYADNPRLRTYAHANMGQERTVNKGFELARGEMLAVVSSDDPVRPGWLSAMAAFIQARPDVLAAYPDWHTIDGEGHIIKTNHPHAFDLGYMLANHACLPGPGTVIRRSGLDQIGGRDPDFRYIGDYEFYLRLAAQGPLARVPQVLATYREHGGTITNTEKSAAHAADTVRVVSHFYDGHPNLPPDIQRLRPRATSAAFIVGARMMATGATPDRGAVITYLLRAVAAYPPILLRHTWRRRWRQALFALLRPHRSA